MRDQLHLMELVDNYLDGAMNSTDRAAFEERMRNSQELRNLVEDQQRIRRAAQRSPARAAAKKAFRNYRWGKMAPGLGAGAVLLITATAVLFLWKSPGIRNSFGDAPLNEIGYRTLTDTAGTHLDPLVLMINPKKDTTLVTPSGIVLDIPQGAFVDSLGAAITTPVRVTLLEALDPLDMMKAGLSTMSGDALLETGGMFYLDAQVNGKPVKIDPAKPLTAMVPAQDDQEDMKLYQGMKKMDGTIDWQNPQPLKKSLVPVDITTLNFYPPGYEAKLAELGQDVTNKAFKDSLYYSFAGVLPSDDAITKAQRVADSLQGAMILDSIRMADESAAVAAVRKWLSRPDSTSKPLLAADTAYSAFSSEGGDGYWSGGIDPAKVKTIWSARFNNTNLATKEFEERLAYIFRTCDNALLDVYVNNLDKDMYWCDSVTTRMHSEPMGMFLRPAYGRVELPAHSADRLRIFYENYSRTEADAIRKTQAKFWSQQWKQDVKSDTKRNEHALSQDVREGALLQKEFEANLDTVYKQLGYKRVVLPRAAWVVPVNNPGWWNVDKAVLQATTTRTSMSYTDDKTGKTATLTYTPLIVEVEDRASYDELVVYLIPNQLNSYQRMKEGEGGFSEKLNSIFNYDLFCLGMKGKQQFAFITSASGRSEITASLAPTDDNGLRTMLRTKGKVEEQLLDESRFLIWSSTDNIRRRANIARQELRSAMLSVVFPCADDIDAP